MKNIDFLPADFRERSARRRGGAWRLIAALAFLAVVVGVDMRLRMARYSADQLLESLQQPYLDAQQTRMLLASTQSELQLANEHASLLAFLEHRWPTTQLLAVPTTFPPDSVHLTQIRLERRTPEADASRKNPAGDFALATPDQQVRAPAVVALEDLRHLSGTEILVLSGDTTDPEAVQRYVTNLTRSPLVKTANLQSITKGNVNQQGESGQPQSQFVVQVTIVDSLAAIAGGESPPQRVSRLDRQGAP